LARNNNDNNNNNNNNNNKVLKMRNRSFACCFYGCENWSFTLREEGRLRVYKNRVLRRILGSERDEVTEEWRKLGKEELNDLYCSTNFIRVIKSRRTRWVGHVAERAG
jgi:hypothetical protein